MELIVAVYEDWGIGQNGTQPVTLSADRKFFRETTAGAWVIVGRKTLADFPGGKPLPGRKTIVLTTREKEIPGAVTACTPEAAAALAGGESCFVIGGERAYQAMLPWCQAAWVTKLHVQPESDTFFPDLGLADGWMLEQVVQSGEERGISYEICRYRRRKQTN